MTATKETFLAAYRDALQVYAWAQDAAKLDWMMEAVRATITRPSGGGPWNHNGPSTAVAWRAIGGAGKVTLKAIRALPDA